MNDLIIELNSLSAWDVAGYFGIAILLVLAYLAYRELRRDATLKVPPPIVTPKVDREQMKRIAARYAEKADQLVMQGDLGQSANHLYDIASGYERAGKGLPR